MLPSGIFVKAELDDLISSLPGRLVAQGPARLTVSDKPEGPDPDQLPVLELCRWSNDWCLVKITSSEEIADLVVLSLVRPEPIGEVLSCHFRPEAGEYSYTLFREGKLLETFESRGPSLETVRFTSELRKIPLQSLLRASDFMIESMGQYGVVSSPGSNADVQKVTFYLNFPGKKTFWQALLGTVSSE